MYRCRTRSGVYLTHVASFVAGAVSSRTRGQRASEAASLNGARSTIRSRLGLLPGIAAYFFHRRILPPDLTSPGVIETPQAFVFPRVFGVTPTVSLHFRLTIPPNPYNT